MRVSDSKLKAAMRKALRDRMELSELDINDL